MYNVQCIIYIHIKDNKLSFRYSTPLHDAVACGRQEIAKILVERGANVGKLYNHDDGGNGGNDGIQFVRKIMMMRRKEESQGTNF